MSSRLSSWPAGQLLGLQVFGMSCRPSRRLGGFLVVCLVIGCQCPTTAPVALVGPQSLQRALAMGVVGGGGPGQGAPVCFVYFFKKYV